MLKHRIATMTVLGGMLFAAGNGVAADGKNYSPLHCVLDQFPPTAQGVFKQYGDTIYNDDSTNTLYLVCPFVHDTGQIAGGTVYAFDRSSTDAVRCTYRQQNLGSAANPLSWIEASGDSGVATNQTQFKSFSIGALSASTAGSSEYAKCSIPPKTASGASHLARLDVVEDP